MKPRSIRTLRRRKAAFCGLRTVDQLGKLLATPDHRLQLMALRPRYHLFTIPKRDGTERWIEDPDPDLKRVQRRLNEALQAVFFFEDAPAAYGFLVSARRDPQPRNILTNARAHLGCRWLYNADVEDFFHSIRWQAVFEVFGGPPFDFDDELAKLLTGLCTHHERLPMGAPASPILSNFACRQLDQQLLELAAYHDWAYTRFADDMSFSSQTEVTQAQRQHIDAIAAEHDFRFNAEKIRLMGPDDEKIVTGLRLDGDRVNLPRGYGKALTREIGKLALVREAQQQMRARSKWVKTYQQRVEGMLNFAEFILGPDHPMVLENEARLGEALDPPDEAAYNAFSWMEWNYL